MIIDTPWTIAVGAELAFPEVQAPSSVIGTLMGRYVNALRRGAVHDSDLAQAFLRVAQLISHPRALLSPKFVMRTLRANLAYPAPRCAMHAETAPHPHTGENSRHAS